MDQNRFMTKIGAWIHDPSNNWFKGQSNRAALYTLYCEAPDTCDLLRLESSCLNCGALSECKFGRKIGTEGPTKSSKSFYQTLQKWREDNEKYIGRLKSLTTYNRILRPTDISIFHTHS